MAAGTTTRHSDSLTNLSHQRLGLQDTCQNSKTMSSDMAQRYFITYLQQFIYVWHVNCVGVINYT